MQALDPDLKITSLRVDSEGNLKVTLATAWGDVTGTLADQADLQAALDAKLATSQLGAPTDWTPVITFATSGDLDVTYSAQVGRYMQIGKLVIAEFYIATSAFTFSTALGNLRVTGLPATAENVTNAKSSGAVALDGWTKAGYSQVVATINANQAFLQFMATGSAQSASLLDYSNFASGTNVTMRGTITYIAE